MRILHTSDWHLGRSLHGADLSAGQQSFLDHLIEIVSSESIDVVAIAGDIYDRAIPSVEATRMLSDSLARIRAAGAQVVAISGNHDSATRLGFGAALMSAGGVHLRTRISDIATPVLIDEVGFYCVPYLEPDVARFALGAELGRTHEAVTSRAVELVRSDAASRGLRSTVILAHGWVTGGQTSDSERDISVGGVGSVPLALFDGFDYVALGHLHGQQTLAAHLRYSGSPMAYSFSEASHAKGSWVVDLNNGHLKVEAIAAPVMRPLRVLRDTVDALLTSPTYEGDKDALISVVATDELRPVEPMDRLRARFAHILAFAWTPPSASNDERSYADRVIGRSDRDIALDFIEHVRSAPSPSEQDLMSAALERAGRGAQ